MSPSMVNARGQEVQAGVFPDLLAGRRRILTNKQRILTWREWNDWKDEQRMLQSQKKATPKTAPHVLQGLDGTVRHEKLRPETAHSGHVQGPRAPWPGPGRWDVAQGESRRHGRGESLASQRPLTASTCHGIHAWQRSFSYIFKRRLTDVLNFVTHLPAPTCPSKAQSKECLSCVLLQFQGKGAVWDC